MSIIVVAKLSFNNVLSTNSIVYATNTNAATINTTAIALPNISSTLALSPNTISAYGSNATSVQGGGITINTTAISVGNSSANIIIKGQISTPTIYVGGFVNSAAWNGPFTAFNYDYTLFAANAIGNNGISVSPVMFPTNTETCLLYTSDAADE